MIATAATCVVSLGTMLGAPATAAAVVPVWPAASAFNAVPGDANTVSGHEIVTLDSVACASQGNCVAVGAYADTGSTTVDQALVTTETNGVWGEGSKLALPSGANPTDTAGGGSVDLISVTCTGLGDCVAVGTYVDASGSYQAMVATETGGVWGQAGELTLPSDQQTTAGRQAAALNSVSCTSQGNCVAVGRYVPTTGTGQEAMVATETGGVWGAGTAITLPSDAFTPSHGENSVLLSVTCTAVGDCATLGYYLNSNGTKTTGDYAAMVATEAGGVWGVASKLTLPSDATNYIVDFGSVTCQSQGNCVGVGWYGDTSGRNDYAAMAITETAGVWAQASKVTLPSDASTTAGDEISQLTSVSCTTPDNDCVAVGSYNTNAAGSGKAMDVTETGGVWSQASAITPPPDAYPTPDDGLTAVACTSPGSCVAVGDYADTAFDEKAMVLSSGPVPLSVLTSSLPSGVVGAPYTAHLAAAGGTGSDTWSISSGSLPAGLTLNGSSGVISGTPSAAGKASLTVTAADSGSPAQHASAALSISVSLPPRSVTTKTFGNQRITLTTPAVSGCVRNTAKLPVTFTSTTIPRSKAAKLTFLSVAFFLDKGVKHVRHETVRTHSGKKTITVIVHTANATAHHVPVSLTLSLKGLKAGIHTLSAVVSYTTIKKIHGHRRKVLATTTVRWKFRVC
jgi:Putative Ig domain